MEHLLSEFEAQLREVEEQARALENRRVYLRRTVEGLRGLLGRPVEDRPMRVDRVRRQDGTTLRRYLDANGRVLRTVVEPGARLDQEAAQRSSRAEDEAAAVARTDSGAMRARQDAIREVREARPDAPMVVREAPAFQPVPTGQAAERPRPKVREAILLILGEIPRIWTLEELVTEMRVRSWLDPDLRAPRETVRAAANRLVERDKLVERIGTRSFRLKQGPEQSPEVNQPQGGGKA